MAFVPTLPKGGTVVSHEGLGLLYTIVISLQHGNHLAFETSASVQLIELGSVYCAVLVDGSEDIILTEGSLADRCLEQHELLAFVCLRGVFPVV